MLTEAAALEREDYAMNAVNIPVTIAPEAAVRIAELGFEKQVAQMIDCARDHLPGLFVSRWCSTFATTSQIARMACTSRPGVTHRMTKPTRRART